jgi:hypothetical protein
VNNRVIVLEGPDGGGKTTIAKWLEKEKGFEYRHEGPPEIGRNQFYHYSEQMYQAMNEDHPIVFDRFHLGELVYGPIARVYDELGHYGLRLFNRLFAGHNVDCFIVLPPYAVAHEEWEKRVKEGAEFLSEEKKYWNCYYSFCALSAWFLKFDRTEMPWEKFYEAIPKKERFLPTGFIGNPTGKFLVVVDDVYNKYSIIFKYMKTKHDLPLWGENYPKGAYGSENGPGTVNNMLWRAGYKEEELLFTSALKADKSKREIILNDGIERVGLAFGAMAANACQEAKMPFFEFPSPYSCKRVRETGKDNIAAYLEQIRQDVLDGRGFEV